MLANMLQMAGLGMTFFYLLKDLPPTWDRKPFATWWVLSVHTIKRQFKINIYVMFSGANCLYTSGQPFMPLRVLVWFFLWRIRCGSHALSEAGQVSSTPAWSLLPACTLPSGSLATLSTATLSRAPSRSIFPRRSGWHKSLWSWCHWQSSLGTHKHLSLVHFCSPFFNSSTCLQLWPTVLCSHWAYTTKCEEYGVGTLPPGSRVCSALHYRPVDM